MQAKGILDNAMMEANDMKAAAVQYTDQLLASVESIISQSIDATSRNNDAIIDSIKQHSIDMVKEVAQSNDSILSALTQYSEMIRSNRADLVQPSPGSTQASGQTAEQVQEGLNLDMLN
jgi:hypothetical protein